MDDGTVKQVAPRTVKVALPEPYAGRYIVARLDFPARVLIELQSGDFARTLTAFDGVVVEHNLPDSTGARAASLLDADPFKMVEKAIELWGEELGKTTQP
jgi:hypothetical protein